MQKRTGANGGNREFSGAGWATQGRPPPPTYSLGDPPGRSKVRSVSIPMPLFSLLSAVQLNSSGLSLGRAWEVPISRLSRFQSFWLSHPSPCCLVGKISRSFPRWLVCPFPSVLIRSYLRLKFRVFASGWGVPKSSRSNYSRFLVATFDPQLFGFRNARTDSVTRENARAAAQPSEPRNHTKPIVLTGFGSV